jgi:exodeoxyribonuclease VII small subunit
VAAKKGKKKANFESAITELESLVEAMEHEDISLEDSLEKFEHGIELTRTCQKALQEAEQKVQTLIEKKSGDTLSNSTLSDSAISDLDTGD